MTEKDIIIIYSKDIYVEEDAKNFARCMLTHSDETTKIIALPSEWVEKVERL